MHIIIQSSLSLTHTHKQTKVPMHSEKWVLLQSILMMEVKPGIVPRRPKSLKRMNARLQHLASLKSQPLSMFHS